jgi:hypothetical protein
MDSSPFCEGDPFPVNDGDKNAQFAPDQFLRSVYEIISRDMCYSKSWRAAKMPLARHRLLGHGITGWWMCGWEGGRPFFFPVLLWSTQVFGMWWGFVRLFGGVEARGNRFMTGKVIPCVHDLGVSLCATCL